MIWNTHHHEHNCIKECLIWLMLCNFICGYRDYDNLLLIGNIFKSILFFMLHVSRLLRVYCFVLFVYVYPCSYSRIVFATVAVDYLIELSLNGTIDLKA